MFGFTIHRYIARVRRHHRHLVEALSGSLCITIIRRGEIRLIVARDGICRGGTASL
jgi:hypothetical protein